MNIAEIFESKDEAEHFAALKRTGFFGNQGAGCIFLAKDTNRFLLAHRSASVEQPGTWGIWGGAIDSHETPQVAATREAEEESGYNGQIKMVPLYIFEAHRNGKIVFKYFNFLAIVPTEFTPHLDWESQGFQWCEFGDWPSPLHFGVTAILNDASSVRKMRQATLA